MTLEELKVVITADTSGIKESVSSANSEISKLSNSSSSVSKAWSSLKNGLNSATTTILKGAAAAGAGVVTIGTKALKARSEVEQSLGGVQTVFGETSGVIEDGQNAWKTVGLSANDYYTQATGYGAFLKNSVKDENTLRTQTAKLIGVQSDVVAAYGIDSETAYNAIYGAMKGNYTMLDNLGLGITGTKAGAQAMFDEFERATGTAVDLENASDWAEVLAWKTEECGVAGYAAAEGTATLSGSYNQCKAAIDNWLGGAGSFQDVLSAINTFLPNVSANIRAMLPEELRDEWDSFTETLSNLYNNILLPLGAFILEHIEIITKVTIVVVALSAAFKVVTAVATALSVVIGILSSPFLGVAAAIAAVIAIGVALYKNWDTVKKYAGILKDGLVAAWNAIKSVTVTVFNAIKEVIITVWEGIKTAITTAVNAIKTVITTVFNGIKTVVTTIWNGIKTVITTVINAIKSGVTSGFNAVKSTVTNVFNGIKSTTTSVWNGIKSTVTSVVNGIKSTITSGFTAAKTSVTSIFNGIKTAISNVMNSAKTVVTGAISKIKSAFNFSWSLPKLKLPHISISGSFSINPPSVPHFGISWYAQGGVLDAPTLLGLSGNTMHIAGEAGAEAVVPLERNTEWLTRIADMLSERQKPTVLTVDGKVFAKTAVETINNQTRQTGNLGLIIA